MSRIFKALVVAILLLALNSTSIIQESLSNHSTDSNLYYKIKNIIRDSKRDLNVGIYVKNLQTNEVKFSYHPHRLFNPASVTKLFTAYAALNYLGPDYTFKTKLIADQSNLYIKFSGDPTLTYKELKEMFVEANIKKINGNIVIDDTMFDNNYSAPGGFTWDDNVFFYAAPVNAVIVDKNSTEAKMWPSKTIGKRAMVSINDPLLLSMQNNVTTVTPKKHECLYKSRYLGKNKYEVYGCMFSNLKKPIKLNFALQDNHLMITTYIRKALTDLGIQFKGKIDFGKAPTQTILHTHSSTSLEAILKDMLQESCNLSSAAIFKHMTAHYTNSQASDEAGEEVLKALLKNAGLNGKRNYVIKDGAGESRYNLVTPEMVVRLLETVHSNGHNAKNIFIDSLAQYKTIGTLKHRTLSEKYNKHIYAKTGTLKTSSTLAGYYLPPDAAPYAFSIMIANHNLPWEEVKELEDKMLVALLEE